ncbi:MAG: hypothetical protein IJ870_03245 [Alphaproteobacteria bacterium]|nr:hypothetical protein [Alphaproteobacteria bacterium]
MKKVLITSNAQTTGVSRWKANSKPTFSRIGKRSLEGTEIPPALAGWFFIFAFIVSLLSFEAKAAVPTYVEEVRALGYLAGQGLACNASKYDTFELIARAFLISKAKSDSEQAQGMQVFNEAKAESFISKIKDNMIGCSQIAASFDNQKIFKTVIYGDGTLKMPDGKIVKPRQIYDATLVYQKDPDARKKMMELYQKTREQITKDPNYQKALRAKQAQDQF